MGPANHSLSTIVLPEQVRLEPFLESGETVSVSDGGGELIQPLGGQTGEELVLGPGGLELWDHQAFLSQMLIYTYCLAEI